MTGADRGRIAEIRVETSLGRSNRGSGYLVANDLVLTATHVVESGSHIRIRFNADLQDEWSSEAHMLCSVGDMCLVRLTTGRPSTAQGSVAFGRVGSRITDLPFTALGFPLWQLRSDSAQVPGIAASVYRDSVQASGSFSTGTSWREGTLDLVVDNALGQIKLSQLSKDRDLQSEWEGMSGAAVWSSSRIVGVVSLHDKAKGLQHLKASRLDHVYRSDAEAAIKFRTLLGLPQSLDDMVDVIPLSPQEILHAEFNNAISEIAPSKLIGRDAEIADLTTFCLGTTPYLWVQAPAWSGKTGISSWFALNPPPSVVVVSFFAIRRQIGHADSTVFLDSVLTQLSIIANESPILVGSISERHRRFVGLLDRAAAAVVADGRKLLLLVDGLDEDISTDSNLPSIASFLPSRHISGLNVLVTGRPHPLPLDVQGNHPLRQCPTYLLSPSPHATALKVEATQELASTLRGTDELSIDILGLLSVSGGLTRLELKEIIGDRSQAAIDLRLEGSLGRSLGSRAEAKENTERIRIFGHATLAETASAYFADARETYLEKIHLWAEAHAKRGWTDSSPQFLLSPYFKLLAADGQKHRQRLIELASSTTRHDVMLNRTYGDWEALIEVETSRLLLQQGDHHFLESSVRLGFEHDRLTDRNAAIPLGSGPLWARLGEPVRARLMVKLVKEPLRRAAYMGEMATAIASGGDPSQAYEVASEITDLRLRLRTLVPIATAFVKQQNLRQAEDIAQLLEGRARAFPDMSVRAEFLALTALCFATLSDAVHAEYLGQEIEQLAKEFNRPKSPVKTSIVVCATLARAGQTERAFRIAEDISDLAWHAEAICEILPFAAPSSVRSSEIVASVRYVTRPDKKVEILAKAVCSLATVAFDEAQALLATLKSLGNGIPGSEARGNLALACFALGELEQGRSVLSSLPVGTKASWVSRAASVLSAKGQLVEAGRLAEDAESDSQALQSLTVRPQVLILVAEAYLAAGRPLDARRLIDEAERLARTAVGVKSIDRWHSIANSLARAGRPDCSLIILNKIEEADRLDSARLRIINELVESGDSEGAIAQVSEISDPPTKVRGLIRVIQANHLDGHTHPDFSYFDQAIVLAAESDEALADPETLSSLMKLMTSENRHDEAEKLLQSLRASDQRSTALLAIGYAHACSGNMDDALRMSASAYLLADQVPAVSPGVSGLLPVAIALEENDVASAIAGLERLDSEHLRAIAAEWILTSPFRIDPAHHRRLTESVADASLVRGVGRALVEAGLIDRARHLVSWLASTIDKQWSRGSYPPSVSSRGLTESYKQLVMETVLAATTHGNVDFAKSLLRSQEARIPHREGIRILGYSLALSNCIDEAWAVLRELASVEDGPAQQSRTKARALHNSMHSAAVLSIIRSFASQGKWREAINVTSDIGTGDVAAHKEAAKLAATGTPYREELLNTFKTMVTATLRLPSDRGDVLAQISRFFSLKGDPEGSVGYGEIAREMMASSDYTEQASTLAFICENYMLCDATTEMAMHLCEDLLSSSEWRYALRLFRKLEPDGFHRIADFLASSCPAAT